MLAYHPKVKTPGKKHYQPGQDKKFPYDFFEAVAGFYLLDDDPDYTFYTRCGLRGEEESKPSTECPWK